MLRKVAAIKRKFSNLDKIWGQINLQADQGASVQKVKKS